VVVRTIAMIVVLGVAVAACIEPSLVPCGDRACPSGTTCVTELQTCATPAQLDACAGKPDEDSCSVGTAIGRCHGGVCLTEGCGNNVIDLGEVCDDGNRHDGDGCSGDCLSLETCGNGYVDRALGEDCDCGADDASKVAGCVMPNSDDPSAECSASCHGRCGDGEIRGAEQCDSTNLGGLACSDVGFYGGTLACTGRCLFDTQTCSGRCGDHTLDVGFEACDGGPPVGACVGAGWDAGEADCGLACRADVTYCNRFGWRQVETVSIASVWGNAQGVMLVGTNGAAWFRDVDGTRHDAPGGGYAAATGSGTLAYAAGYFQVAVWDGATWSTFASPGGIVRAAWADATSVWITIDGAAWSWDGATWTVHDTGQSTLLMMLTGSATRICASNQSKVYCMARATGVWSELVGLVAVTVNGIAIEGSSVWAAAKQGLYRYTSSWARVDTASAVAVTTMPSGGVAARGSTGVVWFSTNPTLRRSLGAITPAAANATYTLVDVAGDLVAGGVDGMYRASTGDWIAAAAPGGSLFVSGGQRTVGEAWSADGLTYTTYFLQLGPTTFLDATYETHFVNAGALYAATDLGLYTKAGTYWTQVDSVVYTNVAMSGDDVLLAYRDAGGTNFVFDFTAATPAISTGTDAPTTLSVDGTGAFYIAVANEVRRYDAGTMTWSPVLTMATAIVDMWIAANGDIVAISGQTVGHLRGGVVQAPIDLPTPLTAVTGGGPDDIFISGSPSGVVSTGVFWYDGHTWTPVRLPSIPTSPIGDIALSNETLVYVDAAGAHELTRLSPWARPP
jgi:cysteine-rich repeat protein